MITLWRRTLNRADLRVELRDGALAMGHFDNRQDALDWLSKHVADEEGRISGQLSEIADEQESVQESARDARLPDRCPRTSLCWCPCCPGAGSTRTLHRASHPARGAPDLCRPPSQSGRPEGQPIQPRRGHQREGGVIMSGEQKEMFEVTEAKRPPSMSSDGPPYPTGDSYEATAFESDDEHPLRARSRLPPETCDCRAHSPGGRDHHPA